MSLSVNIATNAPAVAKLLEHAFAGVAVGTQDPDLAIAFKRVGARILGFERRRFLTLSRSGGTGEWPDLAVSTKVRRLTKTQTQRQKVNQGLQDARDKRALKGKAGKLTRLEYLNRIAKGRKLPILVDTAILFNSLSGGTPDSINDLLPDGIRLGTRVKYAKYHQDPETPGRPPRRRIIVAPDAPTLASCAADIEAGLTRMLSRRMKAGTST